MRIAVIPHPARQLAHEAATSLCTALDGQSVSIQIPKQEALLLNRAACAVDVIESPDFVIAVGGDGTMLSAMAVAYEFDVPVLGVNAGQLAYLAEAEVENLGEIVQKIAARDYEIDERAVLDVRVHSASGDVQKVAINEVVAEREHAGRTARLSVAIGGSFFTTYTADGIILATPTGSTAYSFSARGPIVSPQQRCMLLTPVSPHMLFDRTLVLGPQDPVDAEVLEPVAVTIGIDGHSLGSYGAGTTMHCEIADRPVKLARFNPQPFHQVLKSKFRLPDR